MIGHGEFNTTWKYHRNMYDLKVDQGRRKLLGENIRNFEDVYMFGFPFDASSLVQ
jgi:hypothetical protein